MTWVIDTERRRLMNPIFPFAAIVGQDKLKRALLLCAVNPSLSGVLIRGDKGTAKSTAARGLRELLAPIQRVPGCPYNCAPFVSLPLGATEDRVLGSLDLERVLKEGKRAFQPGLLASAHRGILYIDEVNLLADHLVDSLLDVAAMGQHTIEREGLSLSHPAHITLLGTMNPEEGEVRPQLLDRFAMMVDVAAPNTPALRTEVVRRRLAFEANPDGFIAQWQPQTDTLPQQVQAARNRLDSVNLPDSLLEWISELCCRLSAMSLCADITLSQVARTHAAFAGRETVNQDDIAAAAELALPHRQRRKPFEQPELAQERLNEALTDAWERTLTASAAAPPQPSKANASPADCSDSEEPDSGTPEDETSAGSGAPRSSGEATVFAAHEPIAAATLSVATRGMSGAEGRRSPAPAAARGVHTRAIATPQPQHLAVDATLRHAILRAPDQLRITREDLHDKVVTGRQAHLILLVVDASGSMAARRRMEAVKSCVLGLLHDAYRCRDTVGMIAFRGGQAELALPPTRNVELAKPVLDALPTGGRTPLAQALELTLSTLSQASPAYASPQTHLKPLVILLSDGRSNVRSTDTQESHDPWQHALAAAERFAELGVSALVLDTEQGAMRLNRAQAIAAAMRAEYLRLDEWSAQTFAVTLRERLC